LHHSRKAALDGVGGGVSHEDAGRWIFSPPDASAELVKLRQSKALGVVDENDGGVGDVDADFDDGGGDQHIRFAIPEAGHDGLLFFGGHLAMKRREAQPGERAFGEAVEFFKDRFRIIQAVVDLREDDVGLVMFADLFADKIVRLSGLVSFEPFGLDGLPAGRELVDGAHVKVREIRQSERARDGGGGHDEVMGGVAFGFENGALANAEAMLLVDDDQAEVGEFDVFLNQRLRADGEVDGAVRQLLADRFAGAFGAAGEELDANGRVAQEIGESEIMLLREDFGGREDGGLHPIGNRDQHCIERDDRLARADIALKQAVHRLAGLEIFEYFKDRGFLGIGEGERKSAADSLVKEFVDTHRRRGNPALAELF